MKKLRFLPLFALLLLCLCSIALADTFPHQQGIAAINDANGLVTDLTDDDPTTAWTQSSSGNVDLTIHLYGNTVGEIWLRNGYAYTQNWYNHYSRPDTIKVTVYYRVNQYTTSYDSYRYLLTDAYQPNIISDDWNNGYQRLLLPKKYTGATKIELTIESAIRGFGNTGATISDIAILAGSHATATPKAYATATPKPYNVYITATPGPATATPPLVEFITPRPTATANVELITPKPTDPIVELITPRPTATPKPTDVPTPTPTRVPVDYPTKTGIPATLIKRIATRSGPSNRFDEPGSFFSTGDEVNVISKGWDNENDLWWFQVEFYANDTWYRAYTPSNRVDLDPELVPTDPSEYYETHIAQTTDVYFGPGTQYKKYGWSVLYRITDVKVYIIEGDWAQVEYYDEATSNRRRGWIPKECLAVQP